MAPGTVTMTLRVNMIIPRIAAIALRPFAYLGFLWPTAALTWIAYRTTFVQIDGRWHRLDLVEE